MALNVQLTCRILDLGLFAIEEQMIRVMSKIIFIWLQILSVLLVLGCTDLADKDSQISTYKIPWPNKEGEVQLQNVYIDDLKSPYLMEGASAKIVYRGSYQKNYGPIGQIARPHLIKSNGVFVPVDPESIAAVTSYAHMNRLSKFDKKLGTHSLLKWPRLVGIDTLASLGPNQYGSDNAFYSQENDSINILPYSQSGIPMQVNGNLLAHEHFHALFEKQIKWLKFYLSSAMNGKLGKIKINICESDDFYIQVDDLIASEDFNLRKVKGKKIGDFSVQTLRKTLHQVNHVIAKAWDEGAADFYSYSYIENANWAAESMPTKSEYRAVNKELGGHFRSTPIIVENLKLLNQWRCQAKGSSKSFLPFQSESGYFYLLASDFTKILDRMTKTEIMRKRYTGKERITILKSLLKSLPKIKTYMDKNYLYAFMSPMVPIQLIIEDLKINKDPEVCQLIRSAYGRDYCGWGERVSL